MIPKCYVFENGRLGITVTRAAVGGRRVRGRCAVVWQVRACLQTTDQHRVDDAEARNASRLEATSEADCDILLTDSLETRVRAPDPLPSTP